MDENFQDNDQPNVFHLTLHSAAMVTAVECLLNRDIDIHSEMGLNKSELVIQEDFYESLRDSHFVKYMDLIAPVRDKFIMLLSEQIERGELKAVRTIRKLNGLINPEETTMTFDELYKFFIIHGLEFSSRFYEDYYEVAHNAEADILQQAAWWQLIIRAKIYGFDEPPHPQRILALHKHLAEHKEIEETIEESNRLFDLSIKLRYPSLNDAEVNIKKKERKVHGNVVRFSKIREEILGAAISVLASYPELCSTDSGNVQGTRIAKVLDEKALLFWPETGQPPMESRQIENLLRDWLNKTKATN